MGLELGVIIRELVVKDRDGHAIENDAKGDAGEGKDTSKVGLWVHVAIAHCGNTRLRGERDNNYKDAKVDTEIE